MMDGTNQNNNNPYVQQNNMYQVNTSYQQSNPYHHNPYQPQDNSGIQMAYPSNPQRKNKGIKIAVGIVSALVVLICISVGILAYYRSTPSYRISKGLQNLGKEISRMRNPLADKIGINDILLMMQEDGSHVKTKLNVPVDVPMIGKTTIGVDTDFYQDMRAKELSADTSISIMNWNFAHLNIYANDELFCFSVPELFIEDMYIENENVISQYNQSDLGQVFPSHMEDVSINLFPDENTRISLKDGSDLSETLENFEDDFNACRDGMTIETVERGLYRVTFPEKEIDRLMKDLLESYAEQYGAEEVLQEFKVYKRLIASDISILLEIDGSDRIESILLEDPIDMMDGEASLEGEIFFLGETKSIDKIQGKIEVNGVDGRSRGALWQIQQKSDDDIYQVDTDIKWTEEEKTIGKMKFVMNCDAMKDKFGLSLTLQDAADDFEFVLESGIDDIVKGESVALDLDKMVLSMDGEELLDVTGSVSIEPLTKAIKSSVKPKTAVFEMEFSDWEYIINRLNDEYDGVVDYLLEYLLDYLW